MILYHMVSHCNGVFNPDCYAEAWVGVLVKRRVQHLKAEKDLQQMKNKSIVQVG